jgi:hypothetical protein
LETTVIRDQQGGAAVVKFADLSDEELRRMVWVFPEAYAEYLDRFLKANLPKGLIPKSG